MRERSAEGIPVHPAWEKNEMALEVPHHDGSRAVVTQARDVLERHAACVHASIMPPLRNECGGARARRSGALRRPDELRR
jgi:hypothetical protein